jgi:hypothetical protein
MSLSDEAKRSFGKFAFPSTAWERDNEIKLGTLNLEPGTLFSGGLA